MRRVIRWIGYLVFAIAIVVAVAWWWARPADPGQFYAWSGDVPKPGQLLRTEQFTRGVPPGAVAWRILYATTRGDGSPAVASAIVMTKGQGARTARPVIAWTHGTTGIEPGCAPSVVAKPFNGVPALAALLAQGWTFVGTDYIGLGTQGPHAFLIGRDEAHAALDSIRAARQLHSIALQNRIVVWGHSQGGHAALWTGALARSYAPDVNIVGVAALSPASDLSTLVSKVRGDAFVTIALSYIVQSYSLAYPDVKFGAYVQAWKRPLVADIAHRCVTDLGALISVAETAVAGPDFFHEAPPGGALARRLAENVPRGHIAAPLLIAQGDKDALILPEIQRNYAKERCAAGQSLEYRTYDGRDHMGVVAGDSPLNDDLVRWTKARFAGAPVANSCPGL
jgi:acetyl esterase/lipase